MKGRDFLTVAATLARSQKEPELRTAVGRAYYAAFNHICSFYNGVGIKWHRADRDNPHRQVQNCLACCTSREELKEFAKLSVLLGSLHAQRKKADYEMDASGFTDSSTCQAFVEGAKSCIAKFDKDSKASVAAVREFYTTVLRKPKTW